MDNLIEQTNTCLNKLRTSKRPNKPGANEETLRRIKNKIKIIKEKNSHTQQQLNNTSSKYADLNERLAKNNFNLTGHQSSSFFAERDDDDSTNINRLEIKKKNLVFELNNTESKKQTIEQKIPSTATTTTTTTSEDYIHTGGLLDYSGICLTNINNFISNCSNQHHHHHHQSKDVCKQKILNSYFNFKLNDLKEIKTFYEKKFNNTSNDSNNNNTKSNEDSSSVDIDLNLNLNVNLNLNLNLKQKQQTNISNNISGLFETKNNRNHTNFTSTIMNEQLPIIGSKQQQQQQQQQQSGIVNSEELFFNNQSKLFNREAKVNRTTTNNKKSKTNAKILISIPTQITINEETTNNSTINNNHQTTEKTTTEIPTVLDTEAFECKNNNEHKTNNNKSVQLISSNLKGLHNDFNNSNNNKILNRGLFDQNKEQHQQRRRQISEESVDDNDDVEEDEDEDEVNEHENEHEHERTEFDESNVKKIYENNKNILKKLYHNFDLFFHYVDTRADAGLVKLTPTDARDTNAAARQHLVNMKVRYNGRSNSTLLGKQSYQIVGRRAAPPPLHWTTLNSSDKLKKKFAAAYPTSSSQCVSNESSLSCDSSSMMIVSAMSNLPETIETRSRSHKSDSSSSSASNTNAAKTIPDSSDKNRKYTILKINGRSLEKVASDKTPLSSFNRRILFNSPEEEDEETTTVDLHMRTKTLSNLEMHSSQLDEAVAKMEQSVVSSIEHLNKINQALKLPTLVAHKLSSSDDMFSTYEGFKPNGLRSYKSIVDQYRCKRRSVLKPANKSDVIDLSTSGHDTNSKQLTTDTCKNESGPTNKTNKTAVKTTKSNSVTVKTGPASKSRPGLDERAKTNLSLGSSYIPKPTYFPQRQMVVNRCPSKLVPIHDEAALPKSQGVYTHILTSTSQLKYNYNPTSYPNNHQPDNENDNDENDQPSLADRHLEFINNHMQVQKLQKEILHKMQQQGKNQTNNSVNSTFDSSVYKFYERSKTSLLLESIRFKQLGTLDHHTHHIHHHHHHHHHSNNQTIESPKPPIDNQNNELID